MRYTVIWLPSIERRLTEIWLGSDRRAAITQAADAIDRQVARDPYRAGLRYDEETWQLIVGPLAVLYSISGDDAVVKVMDVDEMP